MDVVGPLENSAIWHQYILLMQHYSTRYLAALPVCSRNAKTIVTKLIKVFARAEVLWEILTEQGTN